MSSYSRTTSVAFASRVSTATKCGSFKDNHEANHQLLRPSVIAIPGVCGFVLNQDEARIEYYENMTNAANVRKQFKEIVLRAMKRRGNKLFPDFKEKRTNPNGVFFVPAPEPVNKAERVTFTVSTPTFFYKSAGVADEDLKPVKSRIAEQVGNFDGVYDVNVYLNLIEVSVLTKYVSQREAKRQIHTRLVKLLKEAMIADSELIFPFAADKGITPETLKVTIKVKA